LDCFPLLVDLLLMVLMVVIPMVCYGRLSRWFKNRNPVLPAVLTAVIEFVTAVLLFAPIWKGESLAPVHLTFVFIPVRWIFVIVGCLLVPLIGAVRRRRPGLRAKILRGDRPLPQSIRGSENSIRFRRERSDALAARRVCRDGPVAEVDALEAKQKHDAALSCGGTRWQERHSGVGPSVLRKISDSGRSQQGARDKPKKWDRFFSPLTAAQAAALAKGSALIRRSIIFPRAF